MTLPIHRGDALLSIVRRAKVFFRFARAHLLLAFMLLIAPSVHAAPGDLDSLDANVVGEKVFATAVQPDGKTIIGGEFSSVLGVPRSNIARLNADGTLDPDFDPKASSTVYGIAIQADGKIVLVGAFNTLQPNGAASATVRSKVARLNTDGTLDLGFDPNASSAVYGVAVQMDGKILLAGGFTSLQPNGAASPVSRSRIARVHADGALDIDFDPNANGDLRSVLEQEDGKILLWGVFTALQPNGALSATPRNRIARLHADGTVDTGFDPNPNGGVRSVLEQADGKILLGGDFTTLQPNGAASATTRNHIARVQADGTLDPGFDPNASSEVFSMALQADGKILLGGGFSTLQPNGAVNATARKYIARVNANGALDSSFDPKANSIVGGVALQADGEVLLGGYFTTLQPNGAASSTTRNFYARLLNDPALHTLSVSDASQVTWTRGGSAPELSQVGFDLSTDGGASWTPLGSATRVGGSSNWQLTGLSLPTSGELRARGRTSGGMFNSSSGLVEQVGSIEVLVLQVPSVTSISPTFGSTVGGAGVTITGTGFTGATAVSIGGSVATSVVVVDDATITAITPAGISGSGSVLVTNPIGTNVANTLYTFAELPVVTGISPSSGSTLGGTSLTITGTGFTVATTVSIGGSAATGVVVVDDVTITAITPAGSSGNSSVLVTNPIGVNPANGFYTYVDSPPGDLDVLDANIVGNYVYATTVQPDGKSIIAGNFNSVLGVSRNHIARLNVDGTLDLDFDPNANGTVRSVVVQADGGVLLGGEFTALQPNGAVSATPRNHLARVNVDGTLDLGFDPGANGNVYCMAVQEDGQILVGGNFDNVGGATHRNIARLNIDGTPDTELKTRMYGSVNCLVVQADGRILVGGIFASIKPTGSGAQFTRNNIARLNADSTLDMDFDPNVSGGLGGVECLAVQADGKILLGGGFATLRPNGATTSTPRRRMARVYADGALDLSFDPNVLGGGGHHNNVHSLSIQADGKILLGGEFTSLQPYGDVNPTSRGNIARLHADGTLDVGFDPNANSEVYSMALQADGKILLAGGFTSLQPNGAANATARNCFARVFNDAASGTLSVHNTSQVIWARGGSAPEVSQVAFEYSSDNGLSWVPVGSPNRVGNSSNWRLTGLVLPATGQIRARGRSSGGYTNGSSGLVEAVESYSGLLPPPHTVTSINPASGTTLGGTSVTLTGTGFGVVESVTIGGYPATSVIVVDANTITAITSRGIGGGASVVVTTPEGTNAQNTLYTYVPIPGDFDPLDFNIDGTVSAAAIQPDGKTIIGGSFSSVLGVPRNFIARLNADGTLDSSFDPNANGIVLSVVVQADGELLIAGNFTALQPNGAASATGRNYIARLEGDGTLDMGFDPNVSNSINSMAIQVDGKILLAGSFTTIQPNGAASSTPRKCIARVESDGTLDTDFDPKPNGVVQGVAVQADGKILLSGYFSTLQPNGATSATSRDFIARLESDGILDTDFDPKPNRIVYSVALQSDGKILIGGPFTTLQPNGAAIATTHNHLARLNDDGTLDMDFDPNPNSAPLSMVVQTDGRILIGGSFTTLQPNEAVIPTTRNYIARLHADGTLDMDFDPNADYYVQSVALQADGRILLGGDFTTLQPNGTTIAFPNKCFARLFNDPATQTLIATDTSRIIWTRGGSLPEVSRVTFEASTDGGASWMPLGNAIRVGGGSNWELTGLSLSASGQIRARGRTSGGHYCSSSGLVETVASYSGLMPPPVDINVAQAMPLTDGEGSVPFASVAIGDSGAPVLFTITNPSAADLTDLVVTKEPGTDAADFTVSALSGTEVPVGSGEVTFHVTFTPGSTGPKVVVLHIASNVVGAKNPFDITLSGTAVTAIDGFYTLLSSTTLSVNDSLPEAEPYSDGVSNLEKYAFNMNLNGSDSSVLTPDSGNSGLPTYALDDSGPTTVVRVQYIRRTGSGLVYTPLKSGDLLTETFEPMNGTETSETLAGGFERVTVVAPCDPATEPSCFWRVRVTLP